VDNVDVNLTRERDAYTITYTITEGQRFGIGNVSSRAPCPRPTATLFGGVVQVQRGDVLFARRHRERHSRIEAVALREGINFVRVEPRITRDERGLLPQHRIRPRPGRAHLRGAHRHRGQRDHARPGDPVAVQHVEGDPFNPREIRESAERIRALGYFADAEVEAREGSSPDTVVIDVNVQERPTGTLSFGVNYSSDGGAALVASLSEENFLGRGQQLDFEISTGRDNRILSFDFTEPRFLGRDLEFGILFDFRQTNNASAVYDTDQARLSPSLGFPVSERGRLNVFYALDYSDITDLREDTTTGEDSDDISPIIVKEAREGARISNILGYTYTFDTRRDAIDTRRTSGSASPRNTGSATRRASCRPPASPRPRRASWART
jgi:outer membrane protein insertion porin family